MRTLTAAFRTELESPQSGELPITFATITHPDLLNPIWVNNDIVDYVYNGNTYLGTAFEIARLNDDEQQPRVRFAINNVDQSIGELFLGFRSAPAVKIELFARSDFTEDIPRVAVGTPTVQFSAAHLLLRNISGDVMTISGELCGQDFAREPWPAIRSTPDIMPALTY